MRVLVDTSILVDYLRGRDDAQQVLEQQRAVGVLNASEITRLELLAGMRPAEEDSTRLLLCTLMWHPVDAEVAERAGALGRTWLASHSAMDTADLAIAATAMVLGAQLLTLNVKHFPMFPDLRRPY